MAGKSAILTFHSLDDSGSVISFPPSRFEAQMERLAASGVRVVPLTEIQQAPGCIALTFDDGYANFSERAWPVLKRLRFPATLFVVSRRVGGDNRWPGQLASIPELKLLDAEAIAALAADGLEIGGHSHTHPDLTTLSEAEAARELDACIAGIRSMTNREPQSFAYPYGRSTPVVERLAMTRFARCVGTHMSYCEPVSARENLPRIDSYYLQGIVEPKDIFAAAGRRMIMIRGAARALRQRIRK